MSDEKPADTFKISLHTSDAAWPEAKTYGPIRYAYVGTQFIEYKNGRWVDEKGNPITQPLTPQEKAAHRP
jgi:hypothetical protein